MGSIFWQIDDTQRGAINRVALIFFAILYTFVTSSDGIPLMLAERPVLYRETAAGAYRPWQYAISFAVAELPYITLVAVASVFVTPSPPPPPPIHLSHKPDFPPLSLSHTLYLFFFCPPPASRST
jgi:hypothetical protein